MSNTKSDTNKKAKTDSSIKLMLALLVLMLALAGMFVFISSQNTKLKSQVNALEQELADVKARKGMDLTVLTSPQTEESAAESENGDAAEEAPVQTEAAAIPPAFEEFTDADGNIVPAAVIYDNGTERWDFPYIEGKGSAPLDFSKVRVENDEKYHRTVYDKDGNRISRFGIDVSKHQGRIDWQSVADDGVEFVFIRVGARGYETGKLTEDERFAENYRGAKDAGLAVGVYYFSQAINEEEGREEAQFVADILKDNGCLLELPVVFDWEKIGGGEIARTDDTPMEDITAACDAFCSTIKDAGYSTAFYSNIRSAFFHYDLSELPYDMWLADYGDTTGFIYDYRFWQYSQSGMVNGVDSFVDFNIWIDE